jgi:hypothetical protein
MVWAAFWLKSRVKFAGKNFSPQVKKKEENGVQEKQIKCWKGYCKPASHVYLCANIFNVTLT